MAIETPCWFTSSYSNNGGQCVEVAWFTSSYSSNGGNCVEVSWSKSSHSENGGNCVEVSSLNERGTVGVRDSKNPTGPALSFPADAFAAFISGIRGGEFGTV